jgi:hypothetical protein
MPAAGRIEEIKFLARFSRRPATWSALDGSTFLPITGNSLSLSRRALSTFDDSEYHLRTAYIRGVGRNELNGTEWFWSIH